MQKNVFVLVFFLCLSNTLWSQISSFSPLKITGGVSQKLTINGSGFGSSQGSNFVSFIQESGQYLDASNSKSLKYLSWADKKIELEMPVAYSGFIKVNVNGNELWSKDTLKVMANLGYRQANPMVYDHLSNNNKKGGYTWYIHKTYWDNMEAKQAIEDVFREFRCKTGINYLLSPIPTQTGFNLGDTVNVIAPDPQLVPVGYHEKLWSSCILGSETFYYVRSHDLHLSTNQNWYFGTGNCPSGKTKFRYVLYHELGHSLGLGHVNELGQSMYPSVSLLPSNNWSGRDSITKEEKETISYFVSLCQNFTFNACGISPLKKVFDCQDVYGTKASFTDLVQSLALLSPNPCSEVLNIAGLEEMDKAAYCVIIDFAGREVTTQPLGAGSLSVSHLNSGLYLLQIFSRGQVYQQKFVKQ